MKYEDFKKQFEESLLSNDINIAKEEIINGYFLCDHGENSVFHYTFKGMPLWVFGMWLEYYDETEDIKSISFFARTKDDLDKFKPSRSSIMEMVKYEKGDQPNEYAAYFIIDILKRIKHTHIISYLDTNYDYEFKQSKFSIMALYTKVRFCHIKNHVRRWYEHEFKFNKSYLKCLFIKNTISKKINISDNNGFYPRYAISYPLTGNETPKDDKNITKLFYRWSGEKRRVNSVIFELIEGTTMKSYSYEASEEELLFAYPIRYRLKKLSRMFLGNK